MDDFQMLRGVFWLFAPETTFRFHHTRQRLLSLYILRAKLVVEGVETARDQICYAGSASELFHHLDDLRRFQRLHRAIFQESWGLVPILHGLAYVVLVLHSNLSVESEVWGLECHDHLDQS